ncbi:methyltransferase domain-containing protein [Arthrobacter sp. CJ23]|uniref:methyltransferase domain-containing protein n=1 Tax=Arthrobacter sp. CJ23 TaxID=2972479 RepID=UPI00215C91EB|nr:methyltransferase domain-containing protein [Arthrobacter sp. CJ23]UVJ41283.1 methyltransferase domain-containing protein [Arthrobacter sp. CJ23]
MSTSTSAVSFRQYGGNAAENYDRYFVPTIGTPFATALLDTAGLQVGERVLDIACGTGVVTRLAAQQVGPTGAVAGLDVNQAMLAVARSAPSSGTAIEWHEANAESLPLADGSFDVVLSSLGLQFVADKASALREMRRVLAPEGRLAIATVGPTPPLFAILEEALGRHVKPEVAAFIRAVFSLYEPQELEKLTSGAGFRNAEVRSKTLSLTLPEPREFLWQYVHSTPLAAAVAQIDDEARAALEHDVVAGWRTFTKDGTITDDICIVLTTARK